MHQHLTPQPSYITQRLFSALMALCVCLGLAQVCRATEQAVWQPTLTSQADWQRLSKPERDAEFTKFVLDVKTGKMYYFDANVFNLHIDFGLGVLLKQPRTYESVKAFNLNYGTVKPQFILGYLTHYPKLNLWTYSFWEGDTITAKDVARSHRALQKTFITTNIKFRPDSHKQERMARGLKSMHIPVITNDQIYLNLPFTAFNSGETTGVLRILPADSQLDTLSFKTTDIVVLQEAYPDISPVAGIITTQFSTPLAHVNLRASAWGIPNAGYKAAATEFAALNNQVVHYRVNEQGLQLRAAHADEIQAFEQHLTSTKSVTLPPADLQTRALKPLSQIRARDVAVYGTKTANLGEIASHGLKDVHVPDGFGLPFYYYAAHITDHGIQANIDQMLADARFNTDVLWRREQLLQLQQQIQNAPISPEHLRSMVQKWQSQLGGKGVFVRSSTNAEDLKGFNGAGLYDTVPNVKTSEALEAAIKKVWASVWNERAVNERAFAGIAHNQVYPAVMIQTGVNASAAGVLLTTDIWGHNPHTYTINAKWGLGIRVVEGQKIPEQVLYDTSNHGTRIISRSSETSMLVFDPKNGVKEVRTPAGDTILTEARAQRLGDAVDKIIPLFSPDSPLDIEWVLEGEKIWIVQARPYVTVPIKAKQ